MNESEMRADQQDTTYIINTESGAETARIVLQAKEVNRVTGLFPNAVLSSIPVDASVLDIGCGPGTWALDVAFDYPVMEITAVDVSKTIIDYAQATALTQNIHNVSFEVVVRRIGDEERVQQRMLELMERSMHTPLTLPLERGRRPEHVEKAA